MILRNAVECKKCGDLIESKHRHDWVQCKCGAIFTDGGTSYIRRGGKQEDMIDHSVFAKEPEEDEKEI